MNTVNSDNNKICWYSAGLHFECLSCGRCCSGPAGGYIWVTGEEIRLLAEYLKMTVGELKKAYLHRVGFRLTLIEDAQTRDCVFLRQGEDGKRCSIYPVRPSQCRTWPFWLSNLTSPDSWNMAGQKCPGINRGTFYSCEQIQAKRDNTRWWSNDGNKEICREVGLIYDWLDERLNNSSTKGDCSACGKCCDFESFGHKLFVTTPEIMYFAEKTGSKNIKPMAISQCPYQIDGKCSVYPERFAGCRIFSCKANADFQSQLTETVIKKFKALCEKFQIPYRYLELPMALKDFLTAGNAKPR